MVDIYYGRAGSGKTSLMKTEAQMHLQNGKRVVFVLPEQLTISRERELASDGLAGAQVLSFSRLANTVFRMLGGTAKKLPDSTMRICAAYLAVSRAEKKLTYYRSVAYNAGFISKLSEAFSEFDTCCITHEKIQALPDLPDAVRRKYDDLFAIYGEYKRLWQDEYKAPGDDLTLAARMISGTHVFDGYVFMFDGFYGFTAQQLMLIHELILCADCVFAFTTDRKSELFYTVTQELNRLCAMCRKAGAAVRMTDVGDTPYRLKTSGMRFLERYALEGTVTSEQPSDGSVKILCAGNINEELDLIACSIKNDMLNGRYRCRDIAVLVPDSGKIAAQACGAFEKHGVPLFADVRKTLSGLPLFALISCALDIARTGFTYENVFRYLKTGLAGMDFDDVNLLESYVRMWQLKDGAFRSAEWTKSPFGLSGKTDDGSRLEKINSLKNTACAPLFDFCEKIHAAKTVRGLLRAIYELTCGLDIFGQLNVRSQYFEEAGDIHLADSYSRAYELYISMLDSIDRVCGDVHMSLHRFCDMFAACADAVDVNARPACVDEVIFADIGRVRTENIKCVYIACLNGEYIPLPPTQSALISESDKRLFNSCGIDTSMDAVSSALRSRFDFYSAICSADEQAVFSYSSFELTGKQLTVSEYLERIFQICCVPVVKAADLPASFFLVSTAGAVSISGRFDGLREISGVHAPEPTDENVKLERDIVYGLYSKNLRLSFSGMDEFVSCPFKFFIHRGLRADSLKPVEMNPANAGTFIHWGLEQLLSNGYDLTGDVSAAADEISKRYLDENLKDCKGSSNRFNSLFSRVADTFKLAAQSVADEVATSGFVPDGFEIDIASSVPPAALENGCTLSLTGSIDRVDIMKSADGEYAKIIDYKSGKQSFSYKSIYNGLSMQLPFYAGAVKKIYPDINIAAMYYIKVGLPQAACGALPMSDAQYMQKLNSCYKRDGVFANDGKTMSALGAVSAFSEIKKDRIVDSAAIDRLIDYTYEKVRETGNAIMDGSAEISPFDGACEYCEYSDICKIGKNPGCVRKKREAPEGFPYRWEDE